MSNVRALRAQHHSGHPGLHLVVSSLPGSNNFPTAVQRIITLACMIGAVAGAYYLAGGYPTQLWQPKVFVAVFGITFFLGIRHVGFKNTLNGMISGILGPIQNQDEGLQTFNARIARWSMTSAHIYALTNLAMAFSLRITELGQLTQNLAPVAVAYLYATLMGITLQTRRDRNQGRFALGEMVLPIVALVIGYFAVNYLNIRV